MTAEDQMKANGSCSSATRPQVTEGSVGVVTASAVGLQEVIGLLAGEGVGISQAICVARHDLGQEAERNAMLAGLQTLQADPATAIIILISGAPSLGAAEQVLARVRNSDKPTVVCFLGGDRRLAWRAGAIPASRLDEAAHRAAAWVRGWDQALISSRLEDEDEQLAARADGLRARIGFGRRLFRGLFTSGIFCQEARLMLADVGSTMTEVTCLDLSGDPSLQLRYLKGALDDAKVAVILLDVVLGRSSAPDPAGILADALEGKRERPVVIAHVCGTGDAPLHLADQEAKLRDAGVSLAPSNATAARLAGLVISA